MSLSPTEKKVARDLIRRYCERSEANSREIHYSQARPMTHLGDSPDSEFWADCSGHTVGAFKWADQYTVFKVRDPGGWNYTGIGNTTTILSTNRKHRVPLDRKFFVGDMALYGPHLGWTKHVVICRKNGDANTSVWTSHGSELGPYPVKLHYRSDLLIVVRAESLL